MIAPAASQRLRPAPAMAAFAMLAVAAVVSVTTGAADLPVRGVVLEVVDRIPLLEVDSGFTARQRDVLWQLRAPRMVIGAVVGAALAVAGAAYQGVFRNPLADPYLLGVAAGAGLGATLAIITGLASTPLLPAAAFAGALVAVIVTYGLAKLGGAGRTTATLILAGVAVASFFTALQTYVQQTSSDTVREVFAWILGRLATFGWSEVLLVVPFVAVSAAVIVAHRRHLDVLAVGEGEAAALGLDVGRVRVLVVLAATLATAAAVAVAGLIGFVGIIVPHAVRLLTGASYRVIVPLSLVGGAAFLVFADIAARTIVSPAELPIGVITAFFGAPFFAMILARSRGAG